jgi:uncharacterized SAM-binding protein YcdF (DUF218 family)
MKSISVFSMYLNIIICFFFLLNFFIYLFCCIVLCCLSVQMSMRSQTRRLPTAKVCESTICSTDWRVSKINYAHWLILRQRVHVITRATFWNATMPVASHTCELMVLSMIVVVLLRWLYLNVTVGRCHVNSWAALLDHISRLSALSHTCNVVHHKAAA